MKMDSSGLAMTTVLDRPRSAGSVSRNAPLSQLWIIPFFVLLVLGTSTVWITHEDYEQTLAQEYRFLGAHARIADAQIAGAMRSIELLLQKTAGDRLNTPPDRLSTFAAGLAASLGKFPELGQLLSTDAAGRIEASSRPQLKGANVSAHRYFNALRDERSHRRDCFVSRPAKAGGDIAITMSCPIVDGQGGFHGIVAATLAPQFFHAMLNQIKPRGAGSAIAVVNREGTILYRLPAPQSYLGASLAMNGPFGRFLHSGESSARKLGASTLEGIERICVFRRIGDTGLNIILADRLDDVLAPWRDKLARRGLFIALIAAATLYLSALAHRRQQQVLAGKTLAEQLMNEGALERQRLRNVLDNLFSFVALLDLDGCLLEVNRVPLELAGIRREEVLGAHFAETHWWSHQPELRTQLRDAMDGARQGRVSRYDVALLMAEGRVMPIDFTIGPLRDHEGRIVQLVASGVDISERKRAEDWVQFLAQHDLLTGLPNRTLFSDRLTQAIAQARRQQTQLVVLFANLDRFKNINDFLGHPVGNQVLQEVARRLTATVRETDTVCRQSGDEFILLVQGISGPEQAAQVAGKLLTALSQPYSVAGRELVTSASIGIACYPRDGEDAEALVMNADAAMHHAKESGRGQYQFFSEQLNADAHARLLLENDLRQALARGEFILNYQPKLDVASGRITGCEALIRWQHPNLGLVSPARFIPVAEETGLIVAIGEWVLEEACREAVRLQTAGFPGLLMCVNVSALQLRQEDFVERVSGILARAGLGPSLLELEVTESMIMHDVVHATRILQQLNDAGIRLAIDDFGTGYSSLAYLKRFPIHVLKIDQSFVRDIMTDPDDAAIVQAIIALAHSLRLGVIAEGVETREQFDFLKAHHCDAVQGYLIAKPLTIDQLLALAG